MYGKTTCFAGISNNEPLLNGGEVYNVYGPQFRDIMDGSTADVAKYVHSHKEELIRSLSGLKRRWSCLEKSIIIRSLIGAGDVAIGVALVWNNERNGTFGYYYNPPYEFHSWIELDKTPFIVDFALPGVIEAGLETSDHIGYILKDIEPVILCGPSPDWLSYKAHEYLNEDEYRQLAAKFSVDIN
jgi:hypothetical protein